MSDTIDLETGGKVPDNKPVSAIVIDETEPADQGNSSDADAIRQAQEAIRARTDAEVRARSAQSENATLRDQLARERMNSQTSKRAVLGQTIQGASSEIQSASAARRAAREAGDLDAEEKAEEALTAARWRKTQAEAELAALPKDGEPTSDNVRHQPVPDNQPQPPSPRLQQWLNEHPRFHADAAYKQAAIALHTVLASEGVTEKTNPDEYYRRINQGLSMAYGENHGKLPGTGDEPMIGKPNGGNNTSTAGVPTKGGGSSGGVKQVELMSNLGTLMVQRRQGAKPVIRFADERTRENMREGAATCWPDQYAKDPNGALARYVESQLEIAEERAGGGTGGVQVTEGVTLR